MNLSADGAEVVRYSDCTLACALALSSSSSQFKTLLESDGGVVGTMVISTDAVSKLLVSVICKGLMG